MSIRQHFIMKKGLAHQSIEIQFYDPEDTDKLLTGDGATSLSRTNFGQSGDTGKAYYWRPGDSSVSTISLAAMTIDTWKSGGFSRVSNSDCPGLCQFGIPDALLRVPGPVYIYFKPVNPNVVSPALVVLDVRRKIDIAPRGQLLSGNQAFIHRNEKEPVVGLWFSDPRDADSVTSNEPQATLDLAGPGGTDLNYSYKKNGVTVTSAAELNSTNAAVGTYLSGTMIAVDATNMPGFYQFSVPYDMIENTDSFVDVFFVSTNAAVVGDTRFRINVVHALV